MTDRDALLTALENENALLRLEIGILTGRAVTDSKINQLQRDNARLRGQIDRARRELIAQHIETLRT